MLPLRHQLTDAPAEVRFLEFGGGFAEANRNIGGFLAVPFADREKQFQQRILHGRRRVADHPQVQQCDSSIVGQKNVPRMGIGVKHAVHQNLFEVGAK